MRFGRVPLAELEGAILAHSHRLSDGKRIAKGTRLGPSDVARLRADGVVELIAAVLDVGDLPEDEAARRIGEALQNGPIRADTAATGRVNLFARMAGVFRADRSIVDALNRIHPGITLATLPDYASVAEGDMVATVKIIPLAVPGSAVETAVRQSASSEPIALRPYRARRVRLVQTTLPGIKASVLDKTARITAERLSRSGSTIIEERRCRHDEADLAAVLSERTPADLVLVFGASAVIDPGDVLPAAIRRAGGIVDQLGMPVDPGNLLLFGRLHEAPIVGAPGCARSVKENGFDWILNRLIADIEVSTEDITGLGVGGLLMEIPSRPQPRDAPTPLPPPRVAAVVLGAGRSTRMGGPNKLLATFSGVPLIRRSVETAIASQASEVVVVVGHRADVMRRALEGLDVKIVENPDHADGLSTSVRLGVREIGSSADGVLMMLADQPLLESVHLDALIEAFRPLGEGSIVLATSKGKRGNPVVLTTRFAADIEMLRGDVGARAIVAANEELVTEVELGAAAAIDVDTPEALAAAGGVLPIE